MLKRLPANFGPDSTICGPASGRPYFGDTWQTSVKSVMESTAFGRPNSVEPEPKLGRARSKLGRVRKNSAEFG